jgi:hypothetical protein
MVAISPPCVGGRQEAGVFVADQPPIPGVRLARLADELCRVRK